MELLTTPEENFCADFVRGKSPLEAYRNNFPNTKKDSVNTNALMRKRNILARICEMRDHVARLAILDGKRVVEEWKAIAFGDVNELIQYQHVNCRHCHGESHHYQWKDKDEFAQALSKAIDAGLKQLPDDKGGYGFKFNNIPNDECPECFGEGTERIFIKDSRYLTPEAKLLYNGVKRTREGIEIITRDKEVALTNLAKYFKLLDPEKKDGENSNFTINIIGGLESGTED